MRVPSGALGWGEHGVVDEVVEHRRGAARGGELAHVRELLSDGAH
jgi:hypothetical protein